MKRFTFLCAAMVFAVVAFAQLSIWNGSSDIWTKGAGTEASPYLIESAEQLAFIAEMVNGGVTTYENTYFKLMTNIDLNNQTWVPIGASEERAFSGHIDGNNYMIFGVLNKPLLNVFVISDNLLALQFPPFLPLSTSSLNQKTSYTLLFAI